MLECFTELFFTIIYLGIYGQWSHLHLAVILAQLTCGCVTRRAAPRPPGHVTGTGPGRLVLLWTGWPGFTSEPVTSGDGPGPVRPETRARERCRHH